MPYNGLNGRKLAALAVYRQYARCRSRKDFLIPQTRGDEDEDSDRFGEWKVMVNQLYHFTIALPGLSL
jgi:hypothetical protein